MKLIDLIIGKIFEAQLGEIRKLLTVDINNSIDVMNANLQYANDSLSFMSQKDRINDLKQFRILVEEDILNIDLSTCSPVRLYSYTDRINEIIENSLEDGLYVAEELPEQVSDTTGAIIAYGDYLQYNNETVDDIVKTQFQQALDTINSVGLSITDGKLQFEKSTPTDTDKYNNAMQWRFEVKISK